MTHRNVLYVSTVSWHTYKLALDQYPAGKQMYFPICGNFREILKTPKKNMCGMTFTRWIWRLENYEYYEQFLHRRKNKLLPRVLIHIQKIVIC